MSDIILLDGGIGQEIVARAGDKPTPLWSTQAMVDHPGVVKDVHVDYFRAGSTIATTNTYAIHRDRLENNGMAAHFDALLEAALNEATEARASFGSGQIVGSIGPLGASYRPDLMPPHQTAVAQFREVAERLAPRVDILAGETVTSLAHADAVLEAASGLGRPVWLAVTLSDDDGTILRSGEKVADLGAIVAKHEPAAVLANCSVPEVMKAGLAELAKFGRPFGAYANGFRRITEGFLAANPTVDALEARDDLDPSAYADFVFEWIDMGATLVGGCCETGPAHIAEIARRLHASGHRTV